MILWAKPIRPKIPMHSPLNQVDETRLTVKSLCGRYNGQHVIGMTSKRLRPPRPIQIKTKSRDQICAAAQMEQGTIGGAIPSRGADQPLRWS